MLKLYCGNNKFNANFEHNGDTFEIVLDTSLYPVNTIKLDFVYKEKDKDQHYTFSETTLTNSNLIYSIEDGELESKIREILRYANNRYLLNFKPMTYDIYIKRFISFIINEIEGEKRGG